MMPMYLRAMGMVNGLGEQLDDIYRGLLEGDPQGMQERSGYLPDRQVRVGCAPVAPGGLELPEALRELSCRNNELLLAAYRPIAAEVEAARDRWGPERVAVVLGTSTSGIAATEQALAQGPWPPGFHYKLQELGMPALFLARYAGLRGPAYDVSTACSSSARAFASARNLLAMGLCDAAVVGGADSLCQMTLQGFGALGALSPGLTNPMSQHRDGINIGEAAALFLMTADGEESRPDDVLLLGVGESSDAHHVSAPDPTGAGAQAAMKMALDDAGLSPQDIDYINLHGTGTPLNDAMESKAVASLFGLEVPCSSTKPLVGHTLGAAGATEIGFCWLLLREPGGGLPPHLWDGVRDPQLPHLRLVETGEGPGASLRACLSNSFAFGGNNCAVILGNRESS